MYCHFCVQKKKKSSLWEIRKEACYFLIKIVFLKNKCSMRQTGEEIPLITGYSGEKE